MADDTGDDKPVKTPVEQAEDPNQGAPEPSRMFDEAYKLIQDSAREKSNGPGKFEFNPTGTAAKSQEGAALQELFKKQTEPEALKKLLQQGVLQAIDIDGKDEGGGKKTAEAAQLAKDGKVTTRIDGNTSIEYNANTNPPSFRKLDKDGNPAGELKDDEKVKIGDKEFTIGQLKKDGIPGFDKAGNPTVTHLDGRVDTKFPNAKEGEVSERTTFPPGYKHEKAENQGLRQVEKINGKGDGNSTENSARTVKHFEDRKETSFEKGDIKSITAFKNPEKGKPAVITERSDGKVETKIKEGPTVNDKGMPTTMKVGDKEYEINYNKDTGKVESLTITDPKAEPPSKLALKMEGEPPKLKIDAANSKPDGKQWNAEELKKLTGIPMEMNEDGSIKGDLQLSKTGALRYKTGDGPDRMEYVRKPDGSLATYDFKNWTRKIEGPDGKPTGPTQAWDGRNWRDIKETPGKGYPESSDLANGKIVFADDKGPKAIERGTPPNDTTKIINKDGSFTNCDWEKGVQTDHSADGKPIPGREFHYDGSTYRAGQAYSKEQLAEIQKKIQEDPKALDKDPNLKALKGLLDKHNGDLSKLDKLVQFTDGKQPGIHFKRNDGTSASLNVNEATGEITRVEQNKKGQVTEVVGPKGSSQYDYDQDGDLYKVTEKDAAGKELKTMTRRGAEKDPGMQSWLGRDGNGRPRSPGDTPPRDPNKPTAYNQWDVTDNSTNPPGKRVETANINTTADGTLRKEVPGPGGKPPGEVLFKPPGGDPYSDNGTHLTYERPGGIKEVRNKADGSAEFKLPDGSSYKTEVDKASGKDKITELTIKNPKDAEKPITFKAPSVIEKSPDSKYFKVTNQDGTSTVLDTSTGTRIDFEKDAKLGKETKIGDDKVLAWSTGIRNDGTPNRIATVDGDKLKLEKTGQTLSNPPWDLSKASIDKSTGELLVPPSTADGKKEIRVKANGAVYEKAANGEVSAKYPNGMEAKFEADGKTLKSASQTIEGKKYEAVREGGKLKFKGPDGSLKDPIPADANFTVDENGKFVAEKIDPNTKVKERIEYDPSKDTAQITRSDEALKKGIVYSQTRDNKVQILLNKMGGRNLPSEGLTGKIDANGKIELDGGKGFINADLSGELRIPQKAAEGSTEKKPDLVRKYDKGGSELGLLADDKAKDVYLAQLNKISQEIAAAGTDPTKLQAAQTAAFNALLSGFDMSSIDGFQRDLKSFQASLNELIKPGKLDLTFDPKTKTLSGQLTLDGKPPVKLERKFG